METPPKIVKATGKAKIDKQEALWRAEDDLRVMQNAEEIKRDKDRWRNAMALAHRRKKDLEKFMSSGRGE